MKDIIQSILIGMSVAAIPGSIFFELVKRTLTKGFWSGFLFSVGNFFGEFLVLLLGFFGLVSFINYPFVQMLLYIIGGSLLIWLGIIALRLKKEAIEEGQTKKGTLNNSATVGFIMAMSNPPIIALWFSLIGSYIIKLDSHFLAFINIFFIAFGVLIFHFSIAGIIHYTKHRIPSKYILILLKIFGIILLGYGASLFYNFLILLLRI